MPTQAQLRALTAVRQLPNLQQCKPAMLIYNEACTPAVIDAVLFVKDIFQLEQGRLRALLAARRPGDAAERIAWIKQVRTRIEAALNATNIIDTWTIGGPDPIDIPNEPISAHKITTLEQSLWPNANSYTVGLTAQAARERASNGGSFSTVHWPLSHWKHFDPYRGNFATVDAWGYDPTVRSALRLFHDPDDYKAAVPAGNPTNLRGLRGLRNVAGNVGVSMRGLGVVGGASGAAPLDRPGDFAFITDQVRAALVQKNIDINDTRGLSPRPNTLFSPYYPTSKFDAILQQHFASHPGANLVLAWKLETRGGPRIYGLLPGGEAIVNYYAAIAKDIVETPYEAFILKGIERWATNWGTWSQRGRITISAAEFRELAQAAASARGRMIAAGGFAITATIASLINPIAGVVMQALGTIADLAMSESAVGYYNCPYPLTRRSALGDCDFSQVLGQDAIDRAGRQTGGIPGYITARSTPPPAANATVSGGVPPWVLLAGGVALAAGLGYYLLKE